MARCSPGHEAGAAPTSETRPFSPPSVGPTHPSHIAGRLFAGPLAPPNPHRLLPPPTSVDEHYRAVSSEPCRRRRTRICSSLASQAQAATQMAGQPRYQVCRFYVRSSSRNGINGAMAQYAHCGDISRNRAASASGGRQQEAHSPAEATANVVPSPHRPPLDNASSCPARSGNRWSLRNVRFLAGSASGRREGRRTRFAAPDPISYLQDARRGHVLVDSCC